jgi:hypothetical protein
MNNNIEYIIILSDKDNEDVDHEYLGNISEKEAFIEYQKAIEDNNFLTSYLKLQDDENIIEYLELRQYDTLKEEYLDWDMSESKYYNKGVK